MYLTLSMGFPVIIALKYTLVKLEFGTDIQANVCAALVD